MAGSKTKCLTLCKDLNGWAEWNCSARPFY